MKKKIFKNAYRLLFITAILSLFISCHGNNYQNVSPTQLTFSTYYGGPTNYNQGAIVYNVSYSGYYGYSNYQYYEVSIDGLGIYDLPYGSNQLTIPYLYPGSYSFQVRLMNNGYVQEYLSGVAYVYSNNTTTVVNAFL
jgi:hypothetical protein